jgi:hypothetical protein
VASRSSKNQRFPWALWLLALLAIGLAYALFVLPYHLPEPEVKIEFKKEALAE